MGELDRDLCHFWKEVASTNTTLPTSSIIKFEFCEDQLDFYIGLSLHSTWIFLPVPNLFYFFTKFVRITCPTLTLALLIICICNCIDL